MDELRFNCPKQLSQKFWMTCRDQEETLGSALRKMMMREILLCDPQFRGKWEHLFKELEEEENRSI